MAAAVDQPPAIETVIIDAARLPPAASEPAFSVVRLNEAQIAPFDRLDVALKQVPALSLFRRTSSLGANPTTQGVSLRAIAPSGAGRSLVTLDGVPQNDPFGGWVIWSSLPPEANRGRLRRARRGRRALWRRRAHRSDRARRTRQRARPRGSRRVAPLGQWRVAGAGGGDIGAVGVFFSGGIEHSDGWTPVQEGAGAADVPLEYDAWNTNARLQSVIGRAVVALRAGLFEEKRSAGLVGANSEASGDDREPDRRCRARAGRARLAAAGMGARQQFAQHVGCRGAGAQHDDAREQSIRDARDRLGLQCRAARHQRYVRVGRRAPICARPMAKRRSCSASCRASSRAIARRAATRWWSAATPKEHALSGPLLITGGARIDWWSSTNAHRIEHNIATGAVTLNSSAPDASGTVPSVRAGVKYDLNETLYLRSAGYTGFRQPTLNELHRSFRVGNDITQANPELKPEHLYGVEAAIGGAEREWLQLGSHVFLQRAHRCDRQRDDRHRPGRLSDRGVHSCRRNAAPARQCRAHRCLWRRRRASRNDGKRSPSRLLRTIPTRKSTAAARRRSSRV